VSVNYANPLCLSALAPEFLLPASAARFPAIPASIAALPPNRQPAAAKPLYFAFCRAEPLSQFSAFSYESDFAAKYFPHTPSRYIGLLAMGSHDEQHDYPENSVPVPMIDRPVVLVGMMGVGKTSIGKRLAGQLGFDFVDADEEIEQAAGMTIAEIFEKFGEPYFRDGERRVIARLIDGKPKVIATGGGAFINEETRCLILERAISIWLDADIKVLVDRVARRSNRPLLKDRDPVEVLTELGKIRNPLYAAANIHVRSDASPHARTVENILKALAP
jgi:shikimate kinase